MNKLSVVDSSVSKNFPIQNVVSKQNYISFRTNDNHNGLHTDTVELSDKNNKKRNWIIAIGSACVAIATVLGILYHKGHADNKGFLDSVKDGWKKIFNKAEKVKEETSKKSEETLDKSKSSKEAEEARKAKEAEEARKAEEAKEAEEAEEARKAKEAEEAKKAKEAEEARKAEEVETPKAKNKVESEKLQKLEANFEAIAQKRINELTTEEFEFYLDKTCNDPVEKEFVKLLFKDTKQLIDSIPDDKDVFRKKINEFITKNTKDSNLSEDEIIEQYTQLKEAIKGYLHRTPDEFMQINVQELIDELTSGLQENLGGIISNELLKSKILLRKNKDIKIKDLADFITKDIEGWEGTDFSGLIKELAEKDLPFDKATSYFPDNIEASGNSFIDMISRFKKLRNNNITVGEFLESAEDSAIAAKVACDEMYDNLGIDLYKASQIEEIYSKLLKKTKLTNEENDFIKQIEKQIDDKEYNYYISSIKIKILTNQALQELRNVPQTMLYSDLVSQHGDDLDKFMAQKNITTSDFIKYFCRILRSQGAVDEQRYNGLLSLANIIGTNPSIVRINKIAGKEFFASNETLLESFYDVPESVKTLKAIFC